MELEELEETVHTLALALLAAPAAFPVPQSVAPCPAAELEAPPDAEVERFGRALALDGDLLVVGAANASPQPASAGGAFAYRRAPEGHWVLEGPLQSLDPDEDDDQGRTVATSAGRVLMGAPLHDGVGPWLSGSAYVFEHDGEAWQQAAKLTAPAPVVGDNFGTALALRGDTAFVGVPYADHVGEDSGLVLVFHRGPGGQWSVVQELVAPDTDAGDYFGHGLALSGTALVVQAPADDDAGPAAGALHVFRRGAGGWNYEARLDTPGAGAPVVVIGPVDVEGDVVVRGDFLDGELGVQAGAVHVWRRVEGGAWMYAQKLLGIDGGAVDSFGGSLALEGGRLAVGSTWDDAAAFDGGAVHLFEDGPGGFAPIAKLLAPDPAHGDRFGSAVVFDADGARLAVGALPNVDPGGEAFLLELAEPAALVGCPGGLPLAAGGAHALRLDAGPAHSGELYLLLGSASGTEPGVPLGSVTLPLAPDAYTLFTVAHPNGPIAGSLGVLDAKGRADAALALAPGQLDATFAGLTLHHAFVAFDAGGAPQLASNAVGVTLAP